MRRIAFLLCLFLVFVFSGCDLLGGSGGEDDGVCSPQKRKCDGSDVVKCNAAGSDWAFFKECPEGCSGGQCLGSDPGEDAWSGGDSIWIPNEELTIDLTYALFPGDIFPTFLSHLFGSPVVPINFLTAFIQNDGDSTADISVSTSLQGYSESAVKQESLAPGESAYIGENPALDFTTLFGVHSPIPGSIKTKIKSNGNVVFEDTKEISIASKNSMFWAIFEEGQWIEMYQFIAVFVTPHDKLKSIDQLLSSASMKMPGNSIVGYQEIAMPEATYTIGDGEHIAEPVFLLPGNSISGYLSYVAGGSDDDINLYVMTSSNYEIWSSGQQANAIVNLPDSISGTAFYFTADYQDTYYVIYHSTNDNWSTRTVTRTRAASHLENIVLHTSAIFNTLREEGVTYVNTPADFFEAAQFIKYPAETLSDLSGNCVEGAVLFASAYEAMGMNAHVAIVPGHAFAAVELWDDEPLIVAVETTMVGGSKNAFEAIQEGMAKWDAAAAAGELIDVNIPECRSYGITPAPM